MIFILISIPVSVFIFLHDAETFIQKENSRLNNNNKLNLS